MKGRILPIFFRGLEEETALHLAASCGCIELITLILKHGAFVDTEVRFIDTEVRC